MEMSQTFLRMFYLNALRDASPRDRYQMIQNITSGQMKAITEVAYHVINRLIPILLIDRRYFRSRRLSLRQLSSSRVSFAVKRRALLHIRSILPRLLRIFYLTNIMRHIARSAEE